MTANLFDFPPSVLPAEAEALRTEVRSFLDQVLPRIPAVELTSSWTTRSPEFSRALGARGWIGMTWPRQYGGAERSALERYVVTEELLARGAPAGSHWLADRQSGPLLLRFGTEQQRQEIVPRIIRGECYFAIGMSEPDSGSDLASVRTRAEPVDGGFRVNGTKIWTSGAHMSHYCVALVRTSGKHGDRQKGLSQLLVDLTLPGITIRPVIDLSGHHDWNEVTFTDCFIPADALLGNEGEGWKQVTSELSHERSGPERFLQNYYVLLELVKVLQRQPSRQAASVLGRLVARLWTLRQMSMSVAGILESGRSPNIESSLVKDLGAAFEQELPEIARLLVDSDATDEGDVARFLDIAQYASMVAPAYTIQGGTTEVLRGIVARGLGLR